MSGEALARHESSLIDSRGDGGGLPFKKKKKKKKKVVGTTKEKRPLIKFSAYGRFNDFRFHFLVRVPSPSGNINTDHRNLVNAAREEVRRVFNESSRIYLSRYGGTLPRIKTIKSEHGMEVRV